MITKRSTFAKLIPIILSFLMFLFLFEGCKNKTELSSDNLKSPSNEKVILTLSSWRKDDVDQMNRILAKFTEKFPNIIVRHEPMSSDDVNIYNNALMAQLKDGKGPDLYYLTSFSLSRPFYQKGYLEPLDSLKALRENFASESLAPWSTDNNLPYGVPFIATSHGIYYNVTAFKKLGLKTPSTWEELIATADKIKNAGLIPFANASGEKWTMAEIVFMNLAPGFTGGRSGRLSYINGERPFNDKDMVSAFQAVKSLAPYLPPVQKELGYTDTLQLFLQGKALMWMGGSWDIPFFEAQKPAFEWSIFPTPPPAGKKHCVTFHLDAGIGLNAASKHKAEALKFLEWLCTPEAGELLGNELPGFFPMHKETPVLKNEHAQTFLAFNKKYETDVRFAWEKINEGTPPAYDLIMEGTISVINGEVSPKQAADNLQAGLAKWYAPAQKFK